MQCPTCQERKRPQPRRHATLDTLPRKWERIQSDTAGWDHPIHKTKHRFVLIVDEGRKYRSGMVLKGNPRTAGSWEDLSLCMHRFGLRIMAVRPWSGWILQDPGEVPRLTASTPREGLSCSPSPQKLIGRLDRWRMPSCPPLPKRVGLQCQGPLPWFFSSPACVRPDA